MKYRPLMVEIGVLYMRFLRHILHRSGCLATSPAGSPHRSARAPLAPRSTVNERGHQTAVTPPTSNDRTRAPSVINGFVASRGTPTTRAEKGGGGKLRCTLQGFVRKIG